MSVCNTNLPRGLNGKEIIEKQKRILTNKDLKFKIHDNDWLLGGHCSRDMSLVCFVTSIYTQRMQCFSFID